MKVFFAVVATLFISLSSTAQESRTVYNFLRLPVAAHASALGGENVTIADDDAAMMFHNPALLCSASDKTIGLDFMTYMAGAYMAGAHFNKAVGKHGTWAASAQFIDYGEMKETNAEGLQTGTFHAKDISIAGYFAYTLTEKLAGGITAKFITSYIGDYSSIGAGIDLGLNYYDEVKGWSASIVAKNLGGQLTAYDDQYERMPIDVAAGVTKRFNGTPLRVSLTLSDLNHWDYKFINHVAAGVEAILSPSIWVGGGYNFRRNKQMGVLGEDHEKSSHGAGLTFGAGVNLERFHLNLAYGKYHVSSSSLTINVAYSL